MSDCASVLSSHSATSISNCKMECPTCHKEIQVRVMFNHIRKLHPDELLRNTTQSWIADAENGKPLRVWWSKLNDFDEEEETVIFACLSTNKTFTNEAKAMQHFQKDKAALKEHNKQLKQLKKDLTAYKKAQQKKKKELIKQDPYILRRNNAFNTNDPDLARAIWRGILNSKKVCELAMMICNRRGYTKDTSMYIYDKRHKMFEQVTFFDFTLYHNALMEKINEAIAEQCMDTAALHKLFIEAYCFWHQNYDESIMGFHADMKALHPCYNYVPDEKFYNYATEEMEGVAF